jgi:DNA repair protein SbcD/Mre11
MKLLHTSDWHVGKAIRGNSRADEHRAVLGEIAGIAAANEVDLVVVAGDLFETAAPTPESEEIVYRALLDLAGTGATVAVIAGNHDNARRLRAVAPLLELGRVVLVTEPTRPADGGVRVLASRSGEEVRLALLPFVSQRGIVRAEQLMSTAAFEQAQAYADRMRLLIELMTAGTPGDVVSVLAAHTFVLGAQTGGGERLAHLTEAYGVPGLVFPASAGYVALGHLHRPQRIPGATAIHYCGSPLQLDFGEEAQAKQVNVVELTAGLPARVTTVPLTAGRPLRTLAGTLDQLAAFADEVDESTWLRVRVRERGRAGLADEVRQLLGPGVVDVLVEAPIDDRGARERRIAEAHSPQEQFVAYLQSEGVEDPRLEPLFAELYDEAVGVDAP